MSERIVTPLGDLNWIFITGQGKKDLNDNDRFSAALYLQEDDPKAIAFKEKVERFWEENKPKGSRKAKSIGIYYEVKDLAKSAEEGKDKFSQVSVTAPYDTENFEKTGRIIVNAWTGTTWPDGKAKIVKTYNAKGNEVSLGERKIGNGSRGTLSTNMAIYENGPNIGVTLYLNGVQITKFVEYTDDVGFDAVEDEDGGWTGEDLNEAGFESVSDDAEPAKPAATSGTKPKVKL